MVSRIWFLVGTLVLMTACGCGGDGDDAATAEDDEPRTTSTTTSTTVSTTSSTTVPSPPPAPPTTVAPAPPAPSGAAISLDVRITSEGQALQSGTLSCGASATGTGMFASPAAAQAACNLLRTNDSAAKLLVYGPPADLLCIEIYGGPEVAKITGTIDTQRVATTLDRTNGCGVAHWKTLAPLLTPAS